MEEGLSTVTSQEVNLVGERQTPSSDDGQEISENKIGICEKNSAAKELSQIFHAQDDCRQKDTCEMVLDVAHQIKEKLGVKVSLPLNGCVLGRENGLTKFDGQTDKPTKLESEERKHTSHEESGRKDPSVPEDPSHLVSNVAHVETCAATITYIAYESELQMPDIMRLIQKDLSEPYSIYTYRYFIHNWPKLCFLAMDGPKCVGAVVCKLDLHKKIVRRGYIAMLAVDENYRKKKIGSNLVLKAIRAMVADDADEVVLETEITNKPALRLYENLGFVRDKRLFRYYLNGVDALRLKLWLR